MNLMYLLSSKNEPQQLKYFKLVFLEIQSATIWSVLLNLVTYMVSMDMAVHFKKINHSMSILAPNTCLGHKIKTCQLILSA